MGSLNLNHLEAFCVLSENLNFSETAKILHTSQPAISLKIKMLEENLGFELFIRDKKNIVLSKEGMELKDKIYQSYKNLVSISPETMKESTLKIGSIYEAGERILVPALTKLVKDKIIPSFHLSLKSSDELLSKLLSGDLDYILVHQIPANKSIQYVGVRDDRGILIGPVKSQLKDLETAEHLPFVSYRENDQYTDNFLKSNFSKNLQNKVTRKISLNSHRSMIKIVNELSMFAVIPKTSLNKSAETKVKVLAEDKKSYKLYLCVRSNYLSNNDNNTVMKSMIKNLT